LFGVGFSIVFQAFEVAFVSRNRDHELHRLKVYADRYRVE